MQLLDTKAIAERYGVKRKTVTDRWTKAPDFPAPVKNISRKSRWWAAQDVDRWRSTSAA